MSVPPGYSNYPRPNLNVNPSGVMQRAPGVYLDAIGDAFTLFKREWTTWVACALIAGFVCGVFWVLGFVAQNLISYGAPTPPFGARANFFTIGAPGAPGVQQTPGAFFVSFFVNLIPNAIYQVAFTGLIVLSVRQIRGLPISVGEVFKPFDRVFSLLGASLMYSLIISLGFVACIVPFFYLFGALCLNNVIIADQNVGAIEGLRRSFAALKPARFGFGMTGLLIVLGILTSISFCLCGVGLLVGIPVYAITLGLHYTYFFPTEYTYTAPGPYNQMPPTSPG